MKLRELPTPELLYWKPSFTKGESVQVLAYTAEQVRSIQIQAAREAMEKAAGIAYGVYHDFEIAASILAEKVEQP